MNPCSDFRVLLWKQLNGSRPNKPLHQTGRQRHSENQSSSLPPGGRKCYLTKSSHEARRMALTPAEKRLATAVAFDHDVCVLIKQRCGGTLRRLTAFTELGKLEEAAGIAV